MKLHLLIFIGLLFWHPCIAFETNHPTDFNSKLMENTFKIRDGNGMDRGTGLLVYKENGKTSYPILLTANHVLSQIVGNQAFLAMRYDTNGWAVTNWNFTIRQGTNKLWKRHPEFDIAAIKIEFPRRFAFQNLSESDLASKEHVSDMGLHPGYQVYCLGYPLGLENVHGFPILHGGFIASYPLLPVSRYPTFLCTLDVRVGNSGGPVYVDKRPEGPPKVIGMVLQEIYSSADTNRVDGYLRVVHMPGMTRVVHAHYLRELLGNVP